MSENVKISKRLFGQLCRYHLMDDRDPATINEIRRELEWKLDAVSAHDRYIPRRHGGVNEGKQGDN